MLTLKTKITAIIVVAILNVIGVYNMLYTHSSSHHSITMRLMPLIVGALVVSLMGLLPWDLSIGDEMYSITSILLTMILLGIAMSRDRIKQ